MHWFRWKFGKILRDAEKTEEKTEEKTARNSYGPRKTLMNNSPANLLLRERKRDNVTLSDVLGNLSRVRGGGSFFRFAFNTRKSVQERRELSRPRWAFHYRDCSPMDRQAGRQARAFGNMNFLPANAVARSIDHTAVGGLCKSLEESTGLFRKRTYFIRGKEELLPLIFLQY